jgi:hypothetical protein
MMSKPALKRPVLKLSALLVVFVLGICGPAAAQGPPTVTADVPSVKGDYVNLSGTIVSPDNCQIGTGTGCPARYIISAPPLPPTAGVQLVPLFWSNQTAAQQLPMAADMRAVRSQLGVPSTTTKYTVVLMAQYSGLVAYSSPQTFTWPAGTLSISNVKLLRADAPTLAYRLDTGHTPFRSARSIITIRTPAGRRVGSFRDSSEPGQNLVRIPRRIARRLLVGKHYRITLRARDEFGRAAHGSALARL